MAPSGLSKLIRGVDAMFHRPPVLPLPPLQLLGEAPAPYHQKAYVTCLDLGDAGALFTRGWDREVEHVGADAKKIRHEINTVWIYPPKPVRAAALASADPQRVTDL